MVLGLSTPVSDKLESSEYLANREEANEFGTNNADTDHLGLAHVPDSVENVGGTFRGAEGLVGGSIGGLESFCGSALNISSCQAGCEIRYRHTVERTSGPSRPSSQAQCRLWSNIWSVVSMLSPISSRSSSYTPMATIEVTPVMDNIQFTNPINRPVRPPMPPKTFPTAPPTLLTALPAELVTLERPSCALDAASEVFSFAALAVSEAVDAWRRKANWYWRRATREMVADMTLCAVLWRRREVRGEVRG